MSASNDKKGKLEKEHFDAFRRLLSDFPAGAVQKGEPPEPDFLVATPSGKLGVELTSIVVEDRRKMESLRDMAVAAGKEEYKRLGGPDVLVSIHWRDRLFPKGVTSRLMGQHLARLVEAHVPKAEDGATDLQWLELRDAGLIDVLSRVRIRRMPGVRTNWSSPGGVWMTSQLEIVQKRLAEKEEKLPGYRNACFEVWLFLVADGRQISETVDTEELSKEILESNFDRIYLLDFFRGRLYPMQLRRPPPVSAEP